MNDNSETKTLGKVIHIDETQIHDHLGELVRGTVEETLNAMLDAEADAMDTWMKCVMLTTFGINNYKPSLSR
jgi:hypothetical protein